MQLITFQIVYQYRVTANFKICLNLIYNFIYHTILQLKKMIIYIVFAIILTVLLFFYKFYYVPYMSIKQYKKSMQSLGYKVATLPIEMLGVPIFNRYLHDEKQYKDPLYHAKNQLQQYDVLISNVLSSTSIQLFNADLIKDFNKPENVHVYHKMDMLVQNVRRSLGSGIAFSQGKQWKRKRSIMNSVFNYDFIIANIPKIKRITEQNFQLLQQQCKLKGKAQQIDGKTVFSINLFQIFASIYSNVMLECFFGVNSTHEKINGSSISCFINKLNSDINNQSFEPLVLLFGTKFANLGIRQKDRDINERILILRQLAKSFINKRLEQLKKNQARQNYQDILEALILKKSITSNASQKKDNQRVKISKQSIENYDFNELIQQFCTFFTAGTDTTSHFTQMMIIYISIYKDVQTKLRNQIDEFIKCDEDINKENLKKLTYIDWIQNQTTRFYGPGNGIFLRIAQTDNYILDIPIKKGTTVSYQPTVNHFNSKYYQNPHEFRPQRWQSQCNNLHPFAFGGFGGGPRSCLGKHLAYLQSKIAIVKFMRRYKQFKLPKQKFTMHAKFLNEPEYMEMRLSH